MVFNIFYMSLVSLIVLSECDVLIEKELYDLKLPTFKRSFPYHLEEASSSQLDNVGFLEKFPKNTLALWEDETLDSFLNTSAQEMTSEHKCNLDLLYMLFNIDSMWFIQMLDASGKPPAGIMCGGVTWLGNSKECQAVAVPVKNIDGINFGGFTGHQCLVHWNLILGPKVQSLTTSICVPSSCNGAYLKNDSDAFRLIISKIPFMNKTNDILEITDIDCSDHVRRWTGGDIAYMCILTIFCLLIVAGTLCDVLDRFQGKNAYIQTKNEISKTDCNQYDNASINVDEEESFSNNVAIAVGKEESVENDLPLIVAVDKNSQYSKFKIGFIKELLICFSAYTNTEKLISVKNQQGQLNCIHGVRFLSMSWIILGHTFVFSIAYLGNPLDAVSILLDSFSFQAIFQGTFAVDTFFFLSGFLLAYLFLKQYGNSDKKVNWVYFYVHRIWRLSPAFYMILGFYTTLWLHLGSGPLWPTETENGNCKKYWWWDVLYIMNFQDTSAKCMAWVWYLANDMQFYVISPLFLIFLWKLPIVGNVLIGVVMLASWIATGIISADNNFSLLFDDTNNNSTAFMGKANKLANVFDDIYIKPYCRIGPYLIGIFVGYVLHKTNDLQKLMKMWLSILGWLIALFLLGIVVFGTYHSHMGKITAATYNSLSRSAWGIVIGWIVYACLTGHGGPVNTLLSWKFWVPLSRLTYCAYLVHPMVMNWYFDSLQSILYFQMTTMVVYYFGFLLCAYLVAFVATLAFESPMMAVEKFILKQFSQS